MLTYDATCFAEHLEEALMSSALEQGRKPTRNCLSPSRCNNGLPCLLGIIPNLRTPRVKKHQTSGEDLQTSGTFFVQDSKVEGTQKPGLSLTITALQMWRLNGINSSRLWQMRGKLQVLTAPRYNVSAAFRARHLQIWGPRHHMAMVFDAGSSTAQEIQAFSREEEDKEGRDEESKDAKAPTEMGEVDDRTLSERKRQRTLQNFAAPAKETSRGEKKNASLRAKNADKKALRQRMKADLDHG